MNVSPFCGNGGPGHVHPAHHDGPHPTHLEPVLPAHHDGPHPKHPEPRAGSGTHAVESVRAGIELL
jgi:hypothetical protein